MAVQKPLLVRPAIRWVSLGNLNGTGRANTGLTCLFDSSKYQAFDGILQTSGNNWLLQLTMTASPTGGSKDFDYHIIIPNPNSRGLDAPSTNYDMVDTTLIWEQLPHLH